MEQLADGQARKLGRHAKALTEEIVETRAEITNVRSENLKYRSAITAAFNS